MLPSGYEFKVPSNLYIIGTMNSADKSISLIDAALRRRFIFEEMIPDASLIDDEELRDCLTKLNEHLKKELRGTDLLIGHSYFMNKTLKDLPDIMNNSIIPLLYEYFYDDEDKIVPAIEACLDNLHLIDPTYKGRKKIRPKS
jgi:5-methylcytosine-specific restriction protein B